MTKLLETAISRINTLSDSEQDAIAAMLIEELSWEASYENSQNILGQLANEALAEYKTGKRI